MKRKILLAMSALALVFISCNRDDENPIETDRKELINNYLNDKKYKFIRKTIDYKLKTEVINYVIDDCTSKSGMEFYADNVGVINEYVKINNDCSHRENKFSWKLDENNQIFAYYNETIVYSISKMENNHLTLSYYDDEDGDGQKEKIILEMKQEVK